MTEMRKFYAAAEADASLGPREIRVVANSGKSDRVKDVMSAKGAKLDNYRKNPIVLADHNRAAPIGNFAPEISGDALTGVITFAPAGISAKADEYCALYKAGVMSTVSIGFNPIVMEPNKVGGYDFNEWELLELSCVAVPCDPDAVTVSRAAPANKAEGAQWKVGASRNLPIGDDAAWNGPAAEKSIFEHCGFDGDKPDTSLARKGFLAYDASKPNEKSSYKLPFAKVIDGRLTAMPAGVRAAASRLPQADTPEDVQKKACAVLDHYEEKMKDKAMKPRIKGLYDVAYLAQILSQLGYLHSDAVREAEVEGDGSKLPAMLADALKVLADALLAMSAEETAELLAGHGVEIIADDDMVMAAPDARTKAWRSALIKAGRALSAENAAHVDALKKCVAAMSDAHVKAMDSHGQTHADLETFRDHLNEAHEHIKALAKAAKSKPKPADDGDGTDEEDTNDDGGDEELAAAAAHRKRMIDIAERSANL